MRSALMTAAAMLATLSLCACDESGSSAGEKTAAAPAFDPTAPANIPEPVRFAKSGPPPADSVPVPLRQAADAAAPASAPSEALENAAYRRGRSFDGVSPTLASLSSRAPAPVRTTAATRMPVKHNSPVPDAARGVVTLADRQLAIDTDGDIRDAARRRRVIAHDRWHRDGTALNVGGRSLDSTVVPYVSIPMGFGYAKLGDLVEVSYNGRSAWAVVGDVGPRERFGEGSVALAERLGIPADGNSGGVWSGVTYRFTGARAPLKSQTTLLAALDAPVTDGPFVLAGL